MRSSSLKTLVLLVCTFASLCEGSLLRCETGPVPVLGGLFCYCLFCFRGLFFVPVVWFFFGCTPSRVCNSAGIKELDMDRHTIWLLLWKVGLWARRLYTETCCFDKNKRYGFNYPLCHVCMWTGVVEMWLWVLSAKLIRDNKFWYVQVFKVQINFSCFFSYSCCNKWL